jgi:hypothetical protein
MNDSYYKEKIVNGINISPIALNQRKRQRERIKNRYNKNNKNNWNLNYTVEKEVPEYIKKRIINMKNPQKIGNQLVYIDITGSPIVLFCLKTKSIMFRC